MVMYFAFLHYYGIIIYLGFTPKRFTVELPFRCLFDFKVLTRLMYPHVSDEWERRSPSEQGFDPLQTELWAIYVLLSLPY
jgi:hypothetical protein